MSSILANLLQIILGACLGLLHGLVAPVVVIVEVGLRLATGQREDWYFYPSFLSGTPFNESLLWIGWWAGYAWGLLAYALLVFLIASGRSSKTRGRFSSDIHDDVYHNGPV
ncbi:MAG: hypothetical protein JNL84_07395 [Candidatus Accumulibacter sp.]|nr:hypothetical protein [Accumulibacter sp.]